jgi:hypothetical protein
VEAGTLTVAPDEPSTTETWQEGQEIRTGEASSAPLRDNPSEFHRYAGIRPALLLA